jgi:hypothetical protein
MILIGMDMDDADMTAVRERMDVLLSALRGPTTVDMDDDGSEDVRFAVIISTGAGPSVSLVTSRDDDGVLRASLHVEGALGMFDFTFATSILMRDVPSRDGAGALRIAESMSDMLESTIPEIRPENVLHIEAMEAEGRMQMLAAYARGDLAAWTHAIQGGLSVRPPSPWMNAAVLLIQGTTTPEEYEPAHHGRLRSVLPEVVAVRNDPYRRTVAFGTYSTEVQMGMGPDGRPDPLETMRAVATIEGNGS